MSTYNVFRPTPTEASWMCRFCMQKESPVQPHYALDKEKGPNAELIKYFERLMGQKLDYSPYLPNHFCNACREWLIELVQKIYKFRQITAKWQQYLVIAPTIQSKKENIINEKPEASGKCIDIVYLDVPMRTEDDDDDWLQDGEQNQQLSDLIEISEDEDDDSKNETSMVAKRPTAKKKRLGKLVLTQLDSRPKPSHWNARNASAACDMCGMWFYAKNQLIGHFARQHSLYRRFSCEVCPKLFRDKEAFDRHSDIHPQQSAFECCGRYYYSEYSITRHRKQVHAPRTQMWKCKDCELSFPMEKQLDQHALRHGEKTQCCDECGRLFYTIKEVKTHKQTVHTLENNFMCETCGLKVATEIKLEQHFVRCNSDANFRYRRPRTNPPLNSTRPMLSCTKCKFKCLRPKTLESHFVLSHPTVDWKLMSDLLCIVCLSQFKTVEESADHQTKYHAKWQCDICKALWNTEESLERHKKIHPIKHRPFSCEVCQATFPTNSQLTLHFRRKHTDERPFACPQCDRRFPEKSEMNQHLKDTHSTARHQCSQCFNTFKTLKGLSYHVTRVHTQDLNYFQCPKCSLKFLNAKDLIGHQFLNHPESKK